MRSLTRWACACLLVGAVIASRSEASDALPDPPSPAVPGRHAEARFHAQQMDADHFERLRVGGVDAIGGVGDWALGNGVLCAVVSDPSHESGLSDRGGVLVDLGHCGRSDDQWTVLRPMISMARDEIPHVESIRAELGEQVARLHTRAHFEGVDLSVRYQLDAVHPERLAIRVRLERVAEGAAARLVALTALHGNGAMSAFTASTSDPARSVGFGHPEMALDSPLLMVDAILPADLQVLVGGAAIEAPIAYGLHIESATRVDAEGERSRLPVVALNGRHFSMLAIFARDFWIGSADSLGWLEVGQALFMDLEPGEAIQVDAAIHVGRRADVASVRDALHPGAATIRGRVSDPRARVHLDRLPDSAGSDDAGDAAAPFSEVRPDGNGRFAMRAPPGRYRVRVTGTRAPAAPQALRVAGQDIDLGSLRVGPPALVGLPRGHAMRLVFLGRGDTPDPSFGDDGRDTRIGERRVPVQSASNDLSLAGVPSDPESVYLDPGSYLVIATRGPEYELSRTRLDVEAGEAAKLEIAPPAPALATPGWISADLHLHAAGSDDSALPVESRIRTLVAQDLEVAVSSDHDQVTDFAPAIAALGVEDRILSLIGCEITSSALLPAVPYSSGHSNVFPVPLEATAYRAGAPRGEGLRLREQIGGLRALGGERVFQLNHPRPRGEESEPLHFFEHLGVAGAPFEPGLPLSAEPNRVLLEREGEGGPRDLDFDALEVLNGPTGERYRRTRADWVSLLLQGERKTATANSDTHQLGEIAAIPRNYLRVAADDPQRVSALEIVRAVRGGRLFGTTGPMLDATLSGEGHGAGLGELFAGSAGTLRVSARAASWIPLDETRVYVNGELVHTAAAANGEPLDLPLRFAADSFVTVEVEGAPSPDGDFARVLPGFLSFAYTNPIFVDADGNGRFDAPGLPAELPSSIRAVAE